MQVPISSHDKTPNDAFILADRAKRKSSSTSLYSRHDYIVDHNELPRVHRTLSNQSITVEANEKKLSKNILSSDNILCNSVNNVNIMPNNISSNVDTGSVKSNIYDIGSPAVLNNSDDGNCFNSPQEKFETSSNISLSSNVTDVPCSVISSLSDYDEATFTNGKIVCTYENTIRELRMQLQETQAQNESYKFALKDLEWKTELEWQEKYQELLRQKVNCDGQLKTLQNQYENVLNDKEKILLGSKSSDEKNTLFREYTNLQLKLSNLERQNSELSSKLVLSTNESKQWQTESSKIETENEKLRVNLQEMKIELDSKNSVLLGLKNKITEQHIELQNHIQAKLKLNNFVTTLNNEIEGIKKSEKWYVEQLHSCQFAKTKIQQELMSKQSSLIMTTQKTEALKLEICQWKNVCEETRMKAMREKEKLLRRMEIIEADMVERETIVKCTTQSEIQGQSMQEKFELQNYVEINLLTEEYEDKLRGLKKTVEEQNIILAEQYKKNADYLVRVTTLQKMLNEKEILCQGLENSNCDLEMKCNAYNENIRTKENQLLELRNKIVNLEVSLHAANREKMEIDEVIKNVREDFNKFMKCYNNMKEKLEEKSIMIRNFECEKQELFMENNWRVCEIEELQQKLLDGKSIQAELMEFKNSYNEVITEKDRLAEENNELKIRNEYLANEKDDNKIESIELNNVESIEQKSIRGDVNMIKENEVVELREMIKIREGQLYNQTQNCELLNSEIKDKEKEINNLKQQIINLNNFIKNESYRINEIKELQLKIVDLNKKLLDSNSVIEQFNTLCRNSELEKYDLVLQLDSIKKQNSIDNNKKVVETVSVYKYFDTETQTEFDDEDTKLNLENVKSKLCEILLDYNFECDILKYLEVNNLDLNKIFIKILDGLEKIVELKNTNLKKIETSENMNKNLRNKFTIFKDKMLIKISSMEHKCYAIQNKNNEIEKMVQLLREYHVKAKKDRISVGIQSDENEDEQSTNFSKEMKNVIALNTSDLEQGEKCNRYEKSNRTLLRKIKEELRGRKTAEKTLCSLQETYNLALTEINNLNILHNRTEVEFETLKSRCSEYKDICDKLNETILSLEKEKGENAIKENANECKNCLELKKLNEDLFQTECKFKTVKDKLYWAEKELCDKEQGITECKKQLFNEKLQSSALKKQVSSIKMCLDNANTQLDTKGVEFSQLKQICDKLESSKMELSEQLENEQAKCLETKRKLEENLRRLEEKAAKDELLADEIKTLSCHLHQKNLELSNAENKLSLLENEFISKENSLQNSISELQNNLTELQTELNLVRNDKFFLQRLCTDLKMSLQGTINQNKVLKLRLETLQEESNDINNKLKSDTSLTSAKIDDDYINRLLKESTVLPDRPLLNLRSCLDSLKKEMANLHQEIMAKTQTSISF